MRREKIIMLTIQAAAMLVISLVIILLGVALSTGDKNDRVQDEYQEQFFDVLPASSYTQIDTDILDRYNEITAVYEGFDEDGTPVGFVIDIETSVNHESSLHVLTGITYDGAQLTGIKHIANEKNPVQISDEEIELVAEQIVGQQIPVSINLDKEIVDVKPETVARRLSGLNDGTYFAQNHNADKSGYIDFVEIDVKDGIITRVQWDAFNVDRTTQNRHDAALSGAYSVSGENWATQSYNLCHALIDCQDPLLLAMKSDGTTDIIPGVTVNIRTFVDLVNECIDYSRAGFTKEDYYTGMDAIFVAIFSGTAEELGIISKDGYIVYSFSDYPNAFDYFEGPDQVFEDRPVLEEDPVNQDSGINSFEDGVNLGGSSMSSNSIDGIPMTEVRTFIGGLDGEVDKTLVVLSPVNVSYKFLKEYLNWLA
ncbi:MAG: hypothetical protein MJ093_00990 [Saccharofermentans sp.]|nr:hypothetical protein [Saccharofermentans sp.]